MNLSPSPRAVGLIAGNGHLPVLFADVLKGSGYAIYAIAHEGETRPELSDWVEDICWIQVGQVEPLIAYFRKASITELVMAGGIEKTRLFGLRPDARGQKILSRLIERKDDLLLRAFAETLEQEGFHLKAVTDYCPDLLAGEGVFTRLLTKTEEADLSWGWPLAKEIGRLDIGQSVVVKEGIVLAVEAADGTDATLRRGGLLGKEKSMAIKICKPFQDIRFDLPTVGVKTIQTMISAHVSCLVMEAHKTLLLDRKLFLDMARAADIAVVGYVSQNVPF